MNITVVDIILVVALALGTYIGWRKGVLKSAISVLGLITIVIISYALKNPVAAFLIDRLPFFNYPGLTGLTSINILVYHVVSFAVIFVILYCILNIILTLTGFIDTLLKFTGIWIVITKIGGAIIGFLETWILVYFILFMFLSIGPLSHYVTDSKVANFMTEHTLIFSKITTDARNAMTQIYKNIEEFTKDENKTTEDLNLRILQIEILNGLVTKEKAQELMETGKIDIDNVYFGNEDNSWLNI